ncbi:MFS transporter [Methylobacterium sp. Leaf112]|uniref:MFS transporter n=1 Tax=Methylobacterium sp. Leaf112 TaxID=1736258 RepID=UPI0009EC7195
MREAPQRVPNRNAVIPAPASHERRSVIRASPIRLWPGVYLLAATHLIAFADRFLITLVAPAMKTALGLSDFEVGLVQGTAFVAVFVLASILCGGLVDRLHRPRFIAASILVWSAASVACGLATSFSELIGARMLLGLGQACLTPLALSLIAERQGRARLGRGISIYTAGATLGRSSALLAGGGLLAVLPATIAFVPPFGPLPPWRAIFVLSCLPNLVLATLYLVLSDPDRVRTSRQDRPRRHALAWLARHARRYAAHTVASAATILIVQSVNAWAVVLYVRRFGLSMAEAGSAFGLVVVLAAPMGHLAGGWIIDRLARSRPRTAAILVLAGCLAITPPIVAVFGLSDRVAVSLTALAGLIFLLGLAAPAGLLGLQTMTPKPLRGRITSLFIAAVTAVGFGIGPPSIGALSDRLSDNGGIGLAIVVVVTVAALLGLSGALAGLRRRA